jgi:hypothetical protein
VAVFAACPRRYYLERYLGWETQPTATAARATSDLPASEFGLQAHTLLAGTPVANPHPEALRLTQLFQSSAIGRRAARANRIEREFDFLLAVEDIVLRGQIDLWFEEKGELILVDYKRIVPGARGGTACRAYGEQLRLYAMALERIVGRLPGTRTSTSCAETKRFRRSSPLALRPRGTWCAKCATRRRNPPSRSRPATTACAVRTSAIFVRRR